MKQLGINEEFEMIYLIPNDRLGKELCILKKLLGNENLFCSAQSKATPALTEITVKVKGILNASELIKKLLVNSAEIDNLQLGWNMGVYSVNEFRSKLSQYMEPISFVIKD